MPKPKKKPDSSNVKWSLKKIGDVWCAKVEIVPRLGTTETVLGDGSDVAIGISAVATDATKAAAMAKASEVLSAMTDDPTIAESLPKQSRTSLNILRTVAATGAQGDAPLKSLIKGYGAATTQADKYALKAVKKYAAVYGVPPEAIDVVHNARKKTESAMAGAVKKLGKALLSIF